MRTGPHTSREFALPLINMVRTNTGTAVVRDVMVGRVNEVRGGYAGWVSSWTGVSPGAGRVEDDMIRVCSRCSTLCFVLG